MARKGKLALALERSLRVLDRGPEDQAAVELARTYARVIDENEDMLNVVGRAFRETLQQLGLTPKARALMAKGDQPRTPTKSSIDELRQRRERRSS